MENLDSVRKVVRNVLKNFLKEQNLYSEKNVLNESVYEEERVSHTEAVENVRNRENFVGSHTFGEDLGDLGQMYAVFSYDRTHPLYLWKGGKWYHNTDDRINEKGKINVWTKKHMAELKPNDSTIGKPKHWMRKQVNDFLKRNNLDLSHTELSPGEK